MKKITYLLMIVFGLSSCSKDESDVSTTEAVLRINAKTVSDINFTGKPIKRNTLPASLKTIFVYTQATGLSEIENQFEIVSDETAGASNDIILKGISLGLTNVRAVARTYDLPVELSHVDHEFVKGKTSVNIVYSELSAHKPIIKFVSKPIDPITIVAGENSPVTFDLLPEQGRAIFIFKLSDELKSLNYSCIFIVRSGGASSNPMESIFDSYTISGDMVTGLIVDGFYVGKLYNNPRIEYEIFDGNNESKFKGAVSIPIVKGASTDKIFTITSDNIPVENTTQTIFKIDDLKNDGLIDGGNL